MKKGDWYRLEVDDRYYFFYVAKIDLVRKEATLVGEDLRVYIYYHSTHTIMDRETNTYHCSIFDSPRQWKKVSMVPDSMDIRATMDVKF